MSQLEIHCGRSFYICLKPRETQKGAIPFSFIFFVSEAAHRTVCFLFNIKPRELFPWFGHYTIPNFSPFSTLVDPALATPAVSRGSYCSWRPRSHIAHKKATNCDNKTSVNILQEVGFISRYYFWTRYSFHNIYPLYSQPSFPGPVSLTPSVFFIFTSATGAHTINSLMVNEFNKF